GNLYISTGDGGNANDAGPGHIEPGGNALNTTTLMGKMLRIHIENTYGTYSIPPDNPFFGSNTDKQEIFCLGLRNPWRNSFDRGSRIPSLGGIYVFADYLGPVNTGRIWIFRYDGRNVSGFRDITSQLFPTRVGNFPLNNPSSLGEDASGELYICDIGNGNIYKIISGR